MIVEAHLVDVDVDDDVYEQDDLLLVGAETGALLAGRRHVQRAQVADALHAD